MYTFGWLSTGRDEAARQLLTEVSDKIQTGMIPGRIGYVFCNREPGEDAESDRFIGLVKNLKIPLFRLSSKKWDPGLKQMGVDRWRNDFHGRVMEIIRGQKSDVVILAGYMLIVSPEMCRRYTMINLHPAAPGGPKGTWQEVIWELIARGAEQTGVMMHLVTEILDEGPPITYCTFPLRLGHFDPLWVEMGAKLGFMPLSEVIQEEGEKNPLFQEIRRQGVMRELPLIVRTMKVLAEGRVKVEGGKVLDREGREIGPYCLNEEIEAHLKLGERGA